MVAVKTTVRKIHFIEYVPGKTKKEDDKPVTVNVSNKFGMMIFGQDCCRELGMVDKFIRLFYEPTKKIIGWQILERSIEHEKMKGIKLVKLNAGTKTYKTSISKMLTQFTGLKDSYVGLPVYKYVESEMLGKGDTFYYVKLKDNQDEGETEE